jgi:hypothetical protein
MREVVTDILNIIMVLKVTKSPDYFKNNRGQITRILGLSWMHQKEEEKGKHETFKNKQNSKIIHHKVGCNVSSDTKTPYHADTQTRRKDTL